MDGLTGRVSRFLESDDKKALVITAAFFAACAVYSFTSVELYSDDDMGHYMIARYALRHPYLFMSVWGRPVFTLLYCPGTQFGLVGGRLTSAVIGALVCYLAYYYARESGMPRAWLAPLLLAVMPRFAGMCYNMDTGLVLCLVLVAALSLHVRGKDRLAAVVMSLAPMARLDGGVYTLVFVACFLYRRKYAASALAFTGVFLWGLAGIIVYGDPRWLIHNNPYTLAYGHGEFLYYFKKFSEITSPIHIPFFLAGVLLALRGWRDRGRLFLVFLWSAYFLFLVLVWWRGAFATIGLTRYFNGTTPLVALISLAGLNWLIDGKKGYFDYAALAFAGAVVVFIVAYGAAAATPVAALSAAILLRSFVLYGGPPKAAVALATAGLLAYGTQVFHPLTPPGYSAEHAEIKRGATEYIRRAPQSFVLCSSIWFYQFTDKDPYDKSVGDAVTYQAVDRIPRGGVVIWEPHYAGGTRYGRVPPEYMYDDKSFALLWRDDNELLQIYQKVR